MIQPHPVKRVFECKHPLDFMGHDHSFQDIPHGQGRLALRHPLLGQMIRHGQYAPQVIRGVAPLRRQPGIVVVQPAHDTANIPGRLYRIESVRSARNTGAMGYNGAVNQRPKVLGAFRKTQGEKAATEGIYQAVSRGIPSLFAFYPIAESVVGDCLQDVVIVGANVLISVGAHCESLIGFGSQ